MANVKGKDNYDDMPEISGNPIVPPGGSINEVLTKNSATDWDYSWSPPGAALRPTFAIWAEENGPVIVSANNYEYSFGNGAINSTSDPSGIPMGVACTLIAISISARNTNTGTSSFSVSVVNNGSVVATGGIASGTVNNAQIKNTTQITPDTVDFAVGDTLQFTTASAVGSVDDVRVCAWFERTA